MIKNIIFDLSEVIISGYHGVEYIIEQKYNISAQDFVKRKQKETLNYFLDTMRGKHTEDEYWAYLLEGTNWNISVDELKNIIRENINLPLDGMIDLLKELKGKCKLILLSDYVKEWYEYLIQHNKQLSIFEHQYFSFDYNRLKQDAGTFDFIINDLNIKPEETLFIDDYESNVKYAQKSGINGIVFKNSNQLREELHKLNVL